MEIKIFAVIIIKTLINKNIAKIEIEKKFNIIQTRIGKKSQHYIRPCTSSII